MTTLIRQADFETLAARGAAWRDFNAALGLASYVTAEDAAAGVCRSCEYNGGGDIPACDNAERTYVACDHGAVGGLYVCPTLAGKLAAAGALFFDRDGDGERASIVSPTDCTEYGGRIMTDAEYQRLFVYTVDAGTMPRTECVRHLGDWYTEEYFYDNYTACSECGEYVPNDCMYYDEYDNPICSECASEREGEYIHGYHDSRRGGYTFIGDAPYIGFELEVEAPNGDRMEGARAVLDALGDAVTLENDSSLNSGGFEIVSMPHSADALAALDIEGALERLQKLGYRSHDGGNCGLHLHFSREWFGADYGAQERGAARLVRFYAAHKREICKLSRREKFDYCSFMDEPTSAYMETDDALVGAKKHGSRYTPINLQNMDGIGTVEIRIGRGTLKASTFRSWVDICIANVRAAARGEDWQTLEPWFNGVSDATREYIESRGVYLKEGR